MLSEILSAESIKALQSAKLTTEKAKVEKTEIVFSQNEASYNRQVNRLLTKQVISIGYFGEPAETASEIYSEACEKAKNNFHKFDGTKASFYTWLYNICKNLLIDKIRNLKKSRIAADYEIDNFTGTNTENPALECVAEFGAEIEPIINGKSLFETSQNLGKSYAYCVGLKNQTEIALRELNQVV